MIASDKPFLFIIQLVPNVSGAGRDAALRVVLTPEEQFTSERLVVAPIFCTQNLTWSVNVVPISHRNCDMESPKAEKEGLSYWTWNRVVQCPVHTPAVAGMF